MSRLTIALGLACSLSACSGGGGGSGSGTDTESGTDSDTDPTSTSTSSTTTSATGTSTSSTSTTTGATDSDSDTSTGTATGTADTSTGTSTSTGSSGTTGGGAATYPACDNGTCGGNEDLCIAESDGGSGDFCGVPCQNNRDCPDPTDGNAIPECVDIPDGSPQTEDLHCVLDCVDQGNELDCPTGMVCATINVVDNGIAETATCVWP